MEYFFLVVYEFEFVDPYVCHLKILSSVQKKHFEALLCYVEPETGIAVLNTSKVASATLTKTLYPNPTDSTTQCIVPPVKPKSSIRTDLPKLCQVRLAKCLRIISEDMECNKLPELCIFCGTEFEQDCAASVMTLIKPGRKRKKKKGNL
ncbi:Hypothetical protein CINCED_3A017337 [Cinara cedri]|uniref:Uncharacterized protein n=1 Tax=Cinara cedri TaxID=506608 RepID=A0A5E4MYQ4_9HEMI|nr:Hypothetical protein CINCED_3A017337 [Cinara cedri]